MFKIPRTGFYDFRILSDDGLRFYYQPVSANIILNEKKCKIPMDNDHQSVGDSGRELETGVKKYIS